MDESISTIKTWLEKWFSGCYQSGWSVRGDQYLSATREDEFHNVSD